MSFEDVRAHCHQVLKTVGRSQESLKILAVSKLQPTEKIRELYQKGHRCFAENYVQEALSKQEALKEFSIEWHLIGSLQKNKVKQVVGRFELIHSVDNLKLAEAVSAFALKNKLFQKILLQVNVAGEESKGGFPASELLSLWPQLQALPNIKIEGLMTMPPLAENPEEVRPYFKQLKQLQMQLRENTSLHSLRELSMGTSHDYHVAIEEGATIVRLGTVLFGERPQLRT